MCRCRSTSTGCGFARPTPGGSPSCSPSSSSGRSFPSCRHSSSQRRAPLPRASGHPSSPARRRSRRSRRHGPSRRSSTTPPTCRPRVPKAGHNIKYDRLVLRRAGVELAGASFDSMLASFVLDPGRRSHALDDLARERLSLAVRTYAELVGRGKAERPFAAVPLADAAGYSATDSEIVLRLHDAFQPELEDHQLVRLLETIEMPLMPVLVDMESRGVCIDLTRLGEISRAFAGELTALERAIYHAAGSDFNINSTPQLRHVLFEKHQLPILKKTKTGPSTDYEVLEQLAAMGHEVPRLLIEYRELSKLKSTYVDALPGFINPLTGRIHTSFNQTGAATGRLSSSDPNLQNIPVRTPRGEAIRRAFVAPPGAMLLTADYSQIELRLLEIGRAHV